MLVSSSSKLIYLATSNEHKYREAQSILKNFSINLKMLKIKTVEIQDDSLSKIAVTALRDAQLRFKDPLLVEDAGLFVDALNGFPGPYSSYVFRTLGVRGVIKVLEEYADRRAEFISVVAFGYASKPIKTFLGRVKGVISHEPRGDFGFGFDPIFQPRGSRKTFGEMSLDEKNAYSHRAKSLKKFCGWYLSHTY